MADLYYDMIEKVHVLIVVDNNKEFLIEVVDLLKSYKYKDVISKNTYTTYTV